MEEHRSSSSWPQIEEKIVFWQFTDVVFCFCLKKEKMAKKKKSNFFFCLGSVTWLSRGINPTMDIDCFVHVCWVFSCSAWGPFPILFVHRGTERIKISALGFSLKNYEENGLRQEGPPQLNNFPTSSTSYLRALDVVLLCFLQCRKFQSFSKASIIMISL